MRLENILALTNAQLINEPFVNSFENIVFKAKAVRRGDLFVAFDKEEIQTAISNGAYGIIFDKTTKISDTEIAWIKVSDIEDAIKRLLRFRIIEKELVAYECHEITISLALQTITEPRIVPLHGNIKRIFKILWDIDKNTIILFSPTLCDKDMFVNSKKISQGTLESIVVMEKTLFETSFIYDDIFYERQPLSPFFIPYLEQLFHLFTTLQIKYKIKKFAPLAYFEAVFVNKKLEIKDFGTTERVVIFEQNLLFIADEINFLRQHASFAQVIYIIPNTQQHYTFINHEKYFFYANENEIQDILENNPFHFAFIVGANKSLLHKALTQYQQLTLEF